MGRLVTRHEAAVLLNVSEQTISNWVSKGALNGHIEGNVMLLDRSSIERYFDTLEDIAFMEKRCEVMRAELASKEKELNESIEDVSSARVLFGNGVPHLLFRCIFDSVLAVAGQDVLSERESSILHRMVIRGQSPEAIGRDYSLTRSRIMQIAERAVRRISCMQNFSDLRRENKRLQSEKSHLQATISCLQRQVETLLQASESGVKSAVHLGTSLPDGLDLSTNVRLLGFSLRVQNCLFNANIKTLGELVSQRPEHLLKHRNFGLKSLHEIDEYFRRSGISWSDV